MKKSIAVISFAILLLIFAQGAKSQAFVHPGIDQNAADLAVMKKKVVAKEEPYYAAFLKLKAASDTAFKAIPHTHVLRGPYGKPNIGGDDLSRSASMAYNYA
jgi:hypothetical protein